MGSILSGVIFLAVGQFIRVYPGILAGYNNRSEKEREIAEKNRLPFYGFLLFSAMGGISLHSYVISRWLEFPHLSSSITLIVTLSG
ncbi:DUF3784 domain-containing protein [Algoriphagus sp.]|uniref:DUF3784 domain-containing protein n=1 Tax=Algoriphagus sp. TaxID=1872435 RepID=UPI002613DE25|nr:DUF3784 domain-containing protein [Algoriphagus sp.]